MSLRRFILSALAILGLYCLSQQWLWAQSNNSASSQDQSWTSTTSSQNSMGVNPVRTRESHTQSGDQTTDRQSTQRLGMDGRYEPYLDVEKQTMKVDASTVRIIQRSYAYTDGQRRLVQTTEEESRTLPGGEVRTVRTASNPDANGSMQMVQRQIEDTRKVGIGVRETTTSVFTADMNGTLSESQRIRQRDTRTDDHTVQFQKTTLLKDGNGNWQTGEVRQGVISDDGKERTREESVSRPDANGNMALVQRQTSKQATDSSGQTKITSETDSVDLPGIPRESGLHPVQRVATVRTPGQGGGQVTQTTVQQPNPGSPIEGMQITVQTTDKAQAGPGGVTRSTRTIQSFAGGNPSTIWVDFGRSDKPAAPPDLLPGQTAPAPTKVQPKSGSEQAP